MMNWVQSPLKLVKKVVVLSKHVNSGIWSVRNDSEFLKKAEASINFKTDQVRLESDSGFINQKHHEDHSSGIGQRRLKLFI